MSILQAIASGQVSRRHGGGASPVFVVFDEPVILRRLEREGLCTSPIGGLPVLQPRGRRLLQVFHGELPRPLPD